MSETSTGGGAEPGQPSAPDRHVSVLGDTEHHQVHGSVDGMWLSNSARGHDDVSSSRSDISPDGGDLSSGNSSAVGELTANNSVASVEDINNILDYRLMRRTGEEL